MAAEAVYVMIAIRRFRWGGRLVKIGSELRIEGAEGLRCALHFARMGWARPADAETRRDVGLALALQQAIPRC